MGLLERSYFDIVLKRLESASHLSKRAREEFTALPMEVSNWAKYATVACEGERPSRSCFIIEGFVCSSKVTGDGKRQITAIHIPGDAPDLKTLHLETLDTNFSTIVPCVLGFIRDAHLRKLCNRNPEVAGALWRATLIDAAVYREWLINIGQRVAPVRMAHLICELTVRMQAVGLAGGTIPSYQLPLTQQELGDALGMSYVHANRTLQELRGTGLISWKGTDIEILDWEGLTIAGDFNPAYLHLKPGVVSQLT